MRGGERCGRGRNRDGRLTGEEKRVIDEPYIRFARPRCSPAHATARRDGRRGGVVMGKSAIAKGWRQNDGARDVGSSGGSIAMVSGVCATRTAIGV